MPFYYFTDKVDEHYRNEVHAEDCSYLPSFSNRTMIGLADSCKQAIQRAESEHPSKVFDGCFWCSYACHKG